MKHSIFFLLLILSLASQNAFSNSSPLNSNSLSVNSEQETVKIFYRNDTFQIQGLTGIGTIQIYTIIGNEIERYNSESLEDFKKSIRLESGNMYIVRVETKSIVKTYKLIAN